MSRFTYIDVLKALSIIVVVLYHTGILTYGYLGVDVFLVIGGYLITKSLWKRIIDNSDIGYKSNIRGYVSFINSRLIRLLPTLLVAGTFTMALGWFTMLPDDYENLGESVIATNFFSNNILAAITTGNYWDIGNDYKPLMHSWYVGVVMQFYLIYPLLFFFSKNSQSQRRTLLTLITILSVASLLFYFATTSDSGRFYYLPSRFFEFGVGGILALLYKPSEERIFSPYFTCICYSLLIALFLINDVVIPDRVRLVLVVVLTCVLILSGSTLANKVTSNVVFAKIGVASYSIYVWHQILLAFFRYTVTSKFSFFIYILLFIVLAIISWLSYKYLEQGITSLIKSNKTKRLTYISIVSLFIALNVFSFYIYEIAGVICDIPELYVSTQNRHRNLHAEYCDRGFLYDKPFVTNDKLHWLVIGNSFGRDFVNVILESKIADKVEVSYTSDYSKEDNKIRFSKADRIFISTLGLNEKMVSEIEIICLANGITQDRVVIVGEKDFGESNGQVYAKRNQPNYFEQYVDVGNYNRFIEKNDYFAQLYGNRYLNIMAMVTNSEGKVRVFTPDCHFISADTRHFSKGGAKYFAEMIEWNKYID